MSMDKCSPNFDSKEEEREKRERKREGINEKSDYSKYSSN